MEFIIGLFIGGIVGVVAISLLQFTSPRPSRQPRTTRRYPR